VISLTQPLRTLGGMVIPVDVKVGTVWGKGLKAWKGTL